MQKLKRAGPVCVQHERGSILVGAVALAIIMAIAGIGFIQVTTSSLNNETAAYYNDKAFQAAESGIWMGVRWLRGDTAFIHIKAPSANISPFNATALSINGMYVYDSIPVAVGADSIPVATVWANVFTSSSKSAATFKKHIIVGNARCQIFGAYCTFYDGYQSTDAGDYPSNWNTGTSWGGWGNRIFNGRFHMNSLCNKLLDATPRFNGLVTIARGTCENDYGIGHNNNNYNYGVWYNPGNPSISQLDQIFTNRYIANYDPINLNIPRTNAASIKSDPTIHPADTILLPSSKRDDGDGPNQYRPTLWIDGQNAHYEYQSTTNSKYYSQTYGPAAGGTIDGKIFLNLSNNLNVYTTKNGATGRFTIATARGKSIVPVGNIVTSDYNITGDSIPSTSNNMIGLISGGYIAFNKSWFKHFGTSGGTSGLADSGTKYVSDSATRVAGKTKGPNDGVDTLHITAAIIAVDTFTDILPNASGTPTAYPMQGCEWWDGMWWQQSTSGNFTDTSNHCEDYSYKLYGNHILGGYSRSIWTSGSVVDTTRGCNGGLIFTYDPRMYNRFLQPPGFPGVSTQDNLLMITVKNWREQNTF